MPQFFIRAENQTGNLCVIEGNDFIHLKKVRRIKFGDLLNLRLPNGSQADAVVRSVARDSLTAEIIETQDSAPADLNLTVCVSLLKGKVFDDVIRKLVEIGASRIIPAVTERSVPRLNNKESGKTERWRRIALEASKQALRNRVPVVGEVSMFNDILPVIDSSVKIIAHTDERSGNLREFLKGAHKGSDAALLIGPEGGFTANEINSARANGWADIRFGRTCMKAETAAVILPALLLYEWSVYNES